MSQPWALCTHCFEPMEGLHSYDNFTHRTVCVDCSGELVETPESHAAKYIPIFTDHEVSNQDFPNEPPPRGAA